MVPSGGCNITHRDVVHASHSPSERENQSVPRLRAVSMGGENMRGRGSRVKERPHSGGIVSRLFFPKTLTFRVPMEKSVYKAHLIRPKSLDLTKIYIV